MTSNRPRTLVVAGAVLLLEAIGAAAFAVAEAMNTNPARPVVGVGTTLLLLAYAGLLAAVARGLWRLRRWSRGPTVATQLIQLPVAWSFYGEPTTWVAVVLGAASLTVLVAVLSPASTAALVPTDAED